VAFAAGFANRLVVDPGAVFSGLVNGGNTLGATAASTLELVAGAGNGTLNGLGTTIVNFANIVVDIGTSWVLRGDMLASGYNVTDGGTLTNQGTINSEIFLTSNAASVVNAAGATIGGGIEAIQNVTKAASFTNAAGGTISNGIDLIAGGMVTNSDFIAGPIAFDGEYAHGTVVNNADATISGGIQFGGPDIGGPVVIANAGIVMVTGGAGAYLGQGGLVTEAKGGTIEGGRYGVQATYGAATVVNAGTLAGTVDAVRMNVGYANRLVIDPGAVFTGLVSANSGFNTAGTTVSTLELASGTSAGTIGGMACNTWVSPTS
jgi:hypothetical protein